MELLKLDHCSKLPGSGDLVEARGLLVDDGESRQALVVFASRSGVLGCAEIDAGSELAKIVAEVKVTDSVVQFVEVVEIAGSTPNAAIVGWENGDTRILELPDLLEEHPLNAPCSLPLKGSQALTVSTLTSSQTSNPAVRIAAAIGEAIRVLQVDLYGEQPHVNILGEVNIGYHANTIHFGGSNARTICASRQGRHTLIRTSEIMQRSNLAVAAEIEPQAKDSNPSESREKGLQGSGATQQSGANPLLAALTLGLVGFNSSPSASREPLLRNAVAVPLNNERWLLDVGFQRSMLKLYSSYGASIETPNANGLGNVIGAATCMGGSVALLMESKENNIKPELRVVVFGKSAAVDLPGISLPHAGVTDSESFRIHGLTYSPSFTAAIIWWPQDRRIGVIRQTRSLEEAADLLEAERQVDAALALLLDVEDQSKSRALIECYARELLRNGKDEEALTYLSGADFSFLELVGLFNETLPDSTRQVAIASFWADAMVSARRRGAAAVDPDRNADETLFALLCMSDTRISRVAALLRARNAVSLDFGENTLRSSELSPNFSPESREEGMIELLRSSGEHDRALSVIEQSPFIPKPWKQALSYMENVGDETTISKHLARLTRTQDTDLALVVRSLANSQLTAGSKLAVAKEQESEFTVLYINELWNQGERVKLDREMQNLFVHSLDRTLQSIDDPASQKQDKDLRREAYTNIFASLLDSGLDDPEFAVERIPDQLWEKRARLLLELRSARTTLQTH
mmetsp:Transcript_11209/g.46800  ORF Transcript_11209/g.46800 Transcript_11209/m.46800 type:complete len:749 (-) Transcript_11209:1945-4191(-)